MRNINIKCWLRLWRYVWARDDKGGLVQTMLTSKRDEIECNFLIGYVVHSIQRDHPLDQTCNFLIGSVVLFNGITHCTRPRMKDEDEVWSWDYNLSLSALEMPNEDSALEINWRRIDFEFILRRRPWRLTSFQRCLRLVQATMQTSSPCAQLFVALHESERQLF